jgi:phosphatidylglycerol:prolipoprotein diacylglycerol transferase
LIHWDVDPNLLQLGPVRIRWYGLMFLMGFTIGYFIVKWMCKVEKKSFERLENLLIYVVLGTAIGARLGHCLFYEPDYYLSHPIEIFKIWEGGLASHGGTVGVIFAIWLYARKHPEFSFMWILDHLSIPTALIAGFIRIGNLMNSEILGRPADLPWSFVFQRIDQIPRHPAQLYESFTYIALFLITITMYRRKPIRPPGLFFGIMLVWIFSWRIVWEMFKENQESFEQGMTLNMGQLLSVPFIIAGIILIIRARRIVAAGRPEELGGGEAKMSAGAAKRARKKARG